MLSPVLENHSLKTMERRKPLAWENCRVHDFRGLTQFFAALCNILLIQSFHLKIVSVFSFCQEIIMIEPILQPYILIISRRSCSCRKPAGSDLQQKQMCLGGDSSVLPQINCRHLEAVGKFGIPFTQPTLSQQMCTAKSSTGQFNCQQHCWQQK